LVCFFLTWKTDVSVSLIVILGDNEKSDGDDDSEDDMPTRAGQVARKGAVKQLWPLDMDETGRAMLPTTKPLSSDDTRAIIRSIVTHAYSKCCSVSVIVFKNVHSPKC